MSRFVWIALFSVGLLGAFYQPGYSASIYSNYLIANTNPNVYWDLDEAAGTTANDTAPLGGVNSGSYINGSQAGALGPRPTDGFVNMSPANLAGDLSQQSPSSSADRVRYNSLNTTAGVGTAQYSAQLWFNSSIDFDDQVLNYLLERGNSTSSTGRRDGVGVGGYWNGGTTPGVLYSALNPSLEIVNGTTVLQPDTWYHLTMVRDDTLPTDRFKVYLNGGLEITSDKVWGGGVGDLLVAGNRTDTNNQLGLIGFVDEVAVWNYALSQEQVSLNYSTAFGFSPSPIPEPATGWLLLMALPLLKRRRTRAALG